MKKKANVIIIGAGAIGCSSAYHLAKFGVKDIVVLEMNQIGSGSSGKTAAVFTKHLSNATNVRMAQYSHARYLDFEEEIGLSIQMDKIGFLAVATEESAASLAELTELLQSLDVVVDAITPKEIKSLFSEINADDLVLGSWAPEDFIFEPESIMQGYARRAREMGVKFHEGVKATGIIVERGKVKGVKTSKGPIASDLIINAAGPWAIEVGRWGNTTIPIINSKRSIALTAPFPYISRERPCMEDMTTEWYVRPETGCMLMGMGSSVADKLDVAFDNLTLEEMIDAAVHRVPVLEKASFQTGWSGIRPMTLDDMPIIGHSTSVDGFLLNVGWGGEGVMQAPIAGQLLAELVAFGEAKTMDISPFRLERFDRVSLDSVYDLKMFGRQ